MIEQIGRFELIVRGNCAPSPELLPEIALRTFASAECRAKAMSTGTVTFSPGSRLPCHRHGFSEAIVVLDGEARFEVEGRIYRLRRLDCIHVPSGIAHETTNVSDRPLVVLWAFASAYPTREFVETEFERIDRSSGNPSPSDPEHIVRFEDAPAYQLAEGTEFRDLFCGRFGAVGICGGYGKFQQGSSLPCHVHDYDESITIVEGTATCEVMGRRYTLSGCDTAVVPQGRPHRFLDESAEPMAMVWVYAGSEPTRTIVDAGYCVGSLTWLHQT